MGAMGPAPAPSAHSQCEPESGSPFSTILKNKVVFHFLVNKFPVYPVITTRIALIADKFTLKR